MARLLCWCIGFAALGAYAQAVQEPPVEKADMVTVVVFLVLFVGSCVAYFVYAIWSSRKKGATAK
jgi:membrane protein DedA with SNARE-associated domain